MKTIMSSRTPQETSFSFSRRYFFNWNKKAQDFTHNNNDYENNDEEILSSFNSSSHSFSSPPSEETLHHHYQNEVQDFEIKSCVLVPKTTKHNKKKKLSVSKFTSFFTKTRSGDVYSTLGSKVIGTLFGYRRGHVHIAFQEDPKTTPAFLIELSTPTSVLVREMASGLVRVALECDKKMEKKGVNYKLLEEPLWRAYCNGRKCGYAMRRECGPHEWRVLSSVGPITMGAGVLPGGSSGGAASEDDVDYSGGGAHKVVKEEGELMYMRAKFERIVGSKDSEAFYMMNPDGNGGPELSVYLLRV